MAETDKYGVFGSSCLRVGKDNKAVNATGEKSSKYKGPGQFLCVAASVCVLR